jgi:hypothetical protein
MSDQMRGPEILVGEQLNAVTFVMDYVQVHFNGPTLTFLVPVYVRAAEHQVVFPGSGGRDALCDLIGAEVSLVQVTDDAISLEFRDGRWLHAPLAGEYREGPEAAHFQEHLNGPLMVW